MGLGEYWVHLPNMANQRTSRDMTFAYDINNCGELTHVINESTFTSYGGAQEYTAKQSIRSFSSDKNLGSVNFGLIC